MRFPVPTWLPSPPQHSNQPVLPCVARKSSSPHRYPSSRSAALPLLGCSPTSSLSHPVDYLDWPTGGSPRSTADRPGASENRLSTLHVSSSHSAVRPPASSIFRSLAEIDSRQISWPCAISSVELVNYSELSLRPSIQFRSLIVQCQGMVCLLIHPKIPQRKIIWRSSNIYYLFQMPPTIVALGHGEISFLLAGFDFLLEGIAVVFLFPPCWSSSLSDCMYKKQNNQAQVHTVPSIQRLI